MEQNKNAIHATGKKTFDFILEHTILPSPRNYELIYLHVAGQTPGISEKILLQLKSGGPLDETFFEGLARDFSENRKKLSDTTADTGAQLDAQMRTIIELVESAKDNASRFGESMEGVSKNLTPETAPQDLAITVETIIQSTREMKERSDYLEGQLTNSRNEISNLREHLEVARAEAVTDQLTGLPNRKAFDDALLKETRNSMEKGEGLCLLLGDIDFFKQFNDTYGHQTGDQVLKLVARCLEASVKGRDTAARYGGEEFAVILPDTSLEDAVKIGNQIRKTVQSRHLVKRSTGKRLGRISMSIGVSRFKYGESIDMFIERADACLYVAKKNGRNQVLCEEDIDTVQMRLA